MAQMSGGRAAVSELIALNKARVIKKRSQREHNAHAYHYTPSA
jgi:hypothetical protein